MRAALTSFFLPLMLHVHATHALDGHTDAALLEQAKSRDDEEATVLIPQHQVVL